MTGGASNERASAARVANRDRETASFGNASGEVIAVVGAGRSGTSATARAVGALGVELGDRLKPGTRKNAKGFFEDEDLLDINYRLRDHFGIKPDLVVIGTVSRTGLSSVIRGNTSEQTLDRLDSDILVITAAA